MKMGLGEVPEIEFTLKRSQHCWPSICKPRPNDGNIWTQQIATLLAQHLHVLAKQSQHLNATDRNIVGCNMLHAFGHLVATCCDMLRVENRTSAHAQAQHCCTNLPKRLQHHAKSTNVAWKTWPFSNLSQHPTFGNKLEHGGQTHATCCARQCGDMLRWNVAIVWPELDVVVLWPSCTRVWALAQFSTRNVLQHVATGRPNDGNMLCRTMLRYVASKCCDRFAGACKYWANNVAICWAELLRSFGLPLRISSAVLQTSTTGLVIAYLPKNRNQLVFQCLYLA